MKRILSFAFCAVLLLTLCSCGDSKADVPLLDGATLVTFGASNTSLSKWPMQVAQALNMHLVNAGIGGNTTAHGLERFDRDVASADPDFVTVCFGTNDFYRNFSEPRVTPEEYRANLTEIVSRVRALGAVPILITSPIISETASGGAVMYPEGSVNAALDVYVVIMREVAAETDTHLIDIHALCDEQFTAAQFLGGDGVHLSATGDAAFGNTVIAYMQEHFRQDPDAPRVTRPTAPAVEKGAWTKSLVPDSLDDWKIIYPGTITADMKDGAVSFANTTGEWPEVHYSPKLENSIAAPVGGSYLTIDMELEAAANVMLFFNGNTPTVQTGNDYLSLTSAIKAQCPDLRVSGNDILGGQTVKCTIPLIKLASGSLLRNDGTVLFSGVKVFVIGEAGKTLTIHELSVTTT